jgi:hypothetical protein
MPARICAKSWWKQAAGLSANKRRGIRSPELAVIAADRSFGKENPMSIAWKNDVDVALAEAQRSKRAVLIDFNAAPL